MSETLFFLGGALSVLIVVVVVAIYALAPPTTSQNTVSEPLRAMVQSGK